MSEPRRGAPEPEQIAGRYQVLQKLGAGAFGTVYKAKDKILGRLVAIKTIRLEGLAASGIPLEELTRRFQQEAQVSAQLRHPNIVTIYDVGESEGMSYLAMEFIDGAGLDKLIAAEKRLSVERVAAIGGQVADALAFAHEHNVVHRDIKPANIMIEAGDRVKVTDFGIAKVTTSGEHLTMTGSLLGTPSYMSPEQARGQTLDGRSDLFAVGSVLYEMTTGTRAFRGDSITGLIFKIITEQPAPMRELDPSIPDELVRIILKAIEKVPEARYQTGHELAQDLLALTRPSQLPTLRTSEAPTSPGLGAPPATMVTPPTAALPGTLGSPPPPPPQPPAAPVAPAAARSPRAASPPRIQAAPPAKRGSTGALIAVCLGALALAAAGAAGVGYLLVRQPAQTAKQSDEPAVVRTTPLATTPADYTAPGAARPEPEARPALPPPTAAAAPADARATATPVPAAPATTTPRQVPDRSGPPAATSGGYAFLDQEPDPEIDGTEAGRRLAESYRSDSSSGGSYGTSARFRRRPRSPVRLVPVEQPAVAALRHVINAQEAFYRENERYGTLRELVSDRALLLDVAISDDRFQRKGYRFELSLQDAGFRVVAQPLAPGPRAFVGDDSGFIRAGLE